MTGHLKALAKAKPIIKLNEPNPMFEKNMEQRDEEDDRQEKDPLIHLKRFEKKLAHSDEYELQREAMKKVAYAKPSMTNKKPPMTMKFTKALSVNRKAAAKTENFLKREHQ